jgi:hypothetical protein
LAARVAPERKPFSAPRLRQRGFWCKFQLARAAFDRAMKSCVQAFLEQVLVSVACNGRHSLKERLAPWLLMMRRKITERAIWGTARRL